MNSNMEKSDNGQFSEFQVNLKLLRQIDFFSGLPLDVLKVFAYLCTREKFKPGQYLFHQNDDDGRGFYIISGTTTLTYKNQNDEEIVRTYESDSFFGSLSLLTSMPRLFSMKAATDVTTMVMTRQKVTKALAQFPELMPKIIKTIASRITMWERQFILDHDEDHKLCKNHIGISLI